MSFINVDTYWFDKMVDERIEQAFNVASEYSGCGLFDADGKLVDTGSYQLTKGTLLEIIQYQQEQITELQYDFTVTWKDLTHYKDECRKLHEQVKHQDHRLDSAFKNIEVLQDEVKCLTVSDGINSSAIEMLLERVKVLEKDISKLKTAFNSAGGSLDIRISKLEKEVEKL